MPTIRFLIPLTLFLAAMASPAPAIDFDLRLDRLSDAFQLLPEADRGSVAEIITNIKNGEHGEALRRLNQLNKANPDNSSLRVLTAYAMLQLGNFLGAFEEADKAHEAPNGNSYKCLFYSKVALLNGNAEACKRELNHVKKAGDMPQEVKKMEAQLTARKKG